mgnify:CR=1 FL=1
MRKQYVKHRIENLVNIAKIVTIHYYELDKNFSYPGESHDFWELVYADKNDIRALRGDEWITLREGELLFHKPMEYHTIASDGKKAPNVLILSFECRSPAMSFFEGKRMRVPDGLRHHLAAVITEARGTFDLPFFDPALKKLRLLPRPNLGGQQIIRTNIEQLLIYLMRAEMKEEERPAVFTGGTLGKDMQNEILAALEENVCGQLPLSALCARFGYSKTYLCAAFRRETGRGIMQYYTLLKIDRAKQLLREGNYNVSQIAQQLCFDTPNYFTKVFRRVTGMTPLQYRRSVGGK